MKVEEAKEKVCPFQEFDYQNKTYCIADKCMAWIGRNEFGVLSDECGYCARISNEPRR